MVCKDCTSDESTGTEQLDPPLPVSTGAPAPAVVTPPVVPTPVPCIPTVVTKICSGIVDECHCSPAPTQPLAKMCTTLAFAMPACNMEVDVLFDKTVDGLLPGLELYAVDGTQKTVRLTIVNVTPSNQLTLRNGCSTCCPSSKPVGEVIPAGTCFTWGIPQCCSSGAAITSNDCLIGTFFFPAAGATAAAKVGNAFNFALGGIYSLGGFLWKVAARVTSTQILLENPAPGNGSVQGGSLEGGSTGECIYPITPVSDVDECNDAAVTSVALSGCTPTGRKKLSGNDDCGLVTYSKGDGSFSVKPLMGGSALAGPHYIDYNPANPCLSKLVYSSDLAGTHCTTSTCAIYLSPLNSSGVYEVEVADATQFTTVAPNNIVTIANRQFTVTNIVVAGAPGKLRIVPRFVVTASETIASQTKICIVEGCQPSPATDWVFGGNLNQHGSLVYCSDTGLRGVPDHQSIVNSIDFSNATDINAKTVGNHDQPEQSFIIANPSATRNAQVTGVISMVYMLTLSNDGEWHMDTLLNIDDPPVTASPTVRAIPIEANYDMNLVSNFALTLAPLQQRTIRVIPRLRTVNDSASNGVRFRGYTARITTHLTTST